MDMKRLAIGTIVGGITMHIVGYLMFDLALVSFYAANDAASATFHRDVNLQWSIGVGNLAFGALLALCITNRSMLPTIASGLMTGAVVGLLVWLGVDFTFYGYQSRWTFGLTLVDPLLAGTQMAIAGAVIAAVLARVPRSAAIRAAE